MPDPLFRSSPSGHPALSLALVRQRHTPFGGAERFLERAMEALRRQGVTITLLARHWQPSPGLDTVSCDPPSLGRLWRDWGFSRCVRHHLRHHEYHLVQSHERIPGCDLYRAGDGVHRQWLRQRRRLLGPVARLAIDWSPYHRYVLAAEKRLFQSSRLRAVICNSHMVRQEIHTFFDTPLEKLHVIHNGVDGQRFHPGLRERHAAETRQRWRVPDGAFLLLYVGSGFQRKGVGVLLEAMARLPERVRLLVVGKDRKNDRYRDRAIRLGLGDRVRFTGGLDDVRPLYGAADALALPTLYDPFPNVVLEAMACALPVVTSTSCGAVDIIEHGVNGLLGDALDRDLLVANIQRLLDPERARCLGAAGRRTVEPMTLDEMSRRMLELYRSLLEPPIPS